MGQKASVEENLRLSGTNRISTDSNSSTEKKVDPKRPSENEIKKRFQDLLANMGLTSEEKRKLEKVSIDVKWRMICKYQESPDRFSMKISDEVRTHIEKLKESPSLVDLQNIQRWLPKADYQQLRNFFLLEGMDMLIKTLEIAEVASRSSKNYYKQIEILKIINQVCSKDEGVKEFLKINDSVTIVFFNLNFFHVELTVNVLEILRKLVWASETNLMVLLEAITKFKNEYKFRYRFEPFLKIIKESKNLVLVESMIKFLNSILSSRVGRNQILILQAEFKMLNCQSILEVRLIFLFLYHLFL